MRIEEVPYNEEEVIDGPHNDEGEVVHRHNDEEVHCYRAIKGPHDDEGEVVHRHGAIRRHEWNGRWRLAEHEFASHQLLILSPR